MTRPIPPVCVVASPGPPSDLWRVGALTRSRGCLNGPRPRRPQRTRSQIVGEAVLIISTGMWWKSQIQSRPRRAYLASCLVALRWEIFGALGTVGTVLYVRAGTFADIVWSAIAGVTVAMLIATLREAMTWFRCAP